MYRVTNVHSNGTVLHVPKDIIEALDLDPYEPILWQVTDGKIVGLSMREVEEIVQAHGEIERST